MTELHWALEVREGGLYVADDDVEQGFMRPLRLDPVTLSWDVKQFTNCYERDKVPSMNVWLENEYLGFHPAEYLPYSFSETPIGEIYIEVTKDNPALGFCKAVDAKIPYMDIYEEIFYKVRAIYPSFAKDLSLGFTQKEECMYCGYFKSVTMNMWAPPCVLLHELGHAYAHAYYPSHVSDEELAWDTAKSLAVDIGYEWSQADDQTMVEALTAYGLA